NRAEQPTHVAEEGRDQADRHRPIEHAEAAVAQHEGERHCSENFDYRKEERVIPDRPEIRVQVVPIDLFETLRGVLLATEKLDDADPADALLQIRVDL